MITATVISIIDMLSTIFYSERKAYMEKLNELNIYPLRNISMKARLINISPKLAVKLLHVKNG